MTHYMNLHPQPYAMIAGGKKTIELRLYDDKRQLIRVGDLIVFSNTQTPQETITVSVQKLHLFPSFEELYKSLPLERCGYLPEEVSTASSRDMEVYYSPSQQAQYGVVGIEIAVI